MTVVLSGTSHTSLPGEYKGEDTFPDIFKDFRVQCPMDGYLSELKGIMHLMRTVSEIQSCLVCELKFHHVSPCNFFLNDSKKEPVAECMASNFYDECRAIL